jgi:AraC-like DNA-binding protein
MGTKVLTSYAASHVLMQIILDKGMPQEDFERQIGVSPDQIKDPDKRIPMSSVLKLFEIAVKLSGDPALALRLRKKTGIQFVHFLVSLVQYSSNLLEAAYHISRYARLISDADKLDIFDAGNCIKITLTNIFLEYNNKWIPEHHASLLVDVTRSLMSNNLNPLSIHFQHSDPGYADVYDEIFKVPVMFQQPENMIVFKKTDFLQPITSHDPNVEAALKNYAEIALKKISRTESLRDKVCEHIVYCLPNGRVDNKKVARAMKMDTSTLYRQLRKEGTTFEELLLDTRRELAKNYLLQGMTNAQVAYLIGFSEPAAFQRAFKRWLGINPGEYRRSFAM